MINLLDVVKAMMPVVEELKRQEGHGDHIGWSTMASSYRDGYPENGTLTLCGCGEILLTTEAVEVTA